MPNGTLVWTNAKVVINSVNLSDHVRKVSLHYGAEMQDETAMSKDTRINKPGLKTWSVDIEFNQDYAASEVNITLFALVGAAAFPIKIQPVSDVLASNNPEFQGNAVLETYDGIDGSVGDLAIAKVTLQSASTLVMDETP